MGTQSEKGSDEKRLLTFEERAKYDDISYVYAGSDPAAQFKPITVMRQKGAPNMFFVAGRYTGYGEKGLLYRPLTQEEKDHVVKFLGAGKIVKFL